MESLSMALEKVTVSGPRDEIDSLMIYLKNEVPCIHVIRNSPHFPFWEAVKNLFLVVPEDELEEAVEKIRSRVKSGSIYKGWMDSSQVFHPISHRIV